MVQSAPPDSAPVTLAEVKAYLRVEHNDEDALIQTLIDAAVACIDGPDGIGIAMVEQEWELSLDRFPIGAIILPLTPCMSVEAITYTDANGDEQELDEALYQVDTVSRPARILPAVGTSWPATQSGAVNTVTIEATFGYDSVPKNLNVALFWLCGHYYENREAVVMNAAPAELPLGVEKILNAYRVGRVA